MKLILIVFITYCVHSLQAQSFANLGCVFYSQIGSYAFNGVLSPVDCSTKCSAQDPTYKYFILYQYDGATCECFYKLTPNSIAAYSSFCDFKCDKNCVTNCAYCGSSDGNYANKYAIGSNTPTIKTTTTTVAKKSDPKNYSSIGCVYFNQYGAFTFVNIPSPQDCSRSCYAQDPKLKYFILDQIQGSFCTCYYLLKPNSLAVSSFYCDFKCDKSCVTNCEYCGSKSGVYGNKYSIDVISTTTSTQKASTTTATTTARSLKTYSSIGCVSYEQYGAYAFVDVFSPKDCLNKCVAQDPNFKYFLLDQYEDSNCECFYRIQPNNYSVYSFYCNYKCDKSCVTNCEYCGSIDGNYGNKYAINSV